MNLYPGCFNKATSILTRSQLLPLSNNCSVLHGSSHTLLVQRLLPPSNKTLPLVAQRSQGDLKPFLWCSEHLVPKPFKDNILPKGRLLTLKAIDLRLCSQTVLWMNVCVRGQVVHPFLVWMKDKSKLCYWQCRLNLYNQPLGTRLEFRPFFFFFSLTVGN